MRTQRNLVRTQRGMVYKFKCALNESALNEVRTQRGIAVDTQNNFYFANDENPTPTTAVLVPISILYYSFRNAMHVHCIFYPCSLLLFVVVLHGRLTFWRKFKLLFFVCAAAAVALRRKMYLTLFFISLAWADERSLPPWACDLVIILLAMTPATAD